MSGSPNHHPKKKTELNSTRTPSPSSFGRESRQHGTDKLNTRAVAGEMRRSARVLVGLDSFSLLGVEQGKLVGRKSVKIC